MSNAIRLILGWAPLVLSVVGWPVSALTFARQEPPTVLALSWLAIILTALNVLLTMHVRNRQDDGGADT